MHLFVKQFRGIRGSVRAEFPPFGIRGPKTSPVATRGEFHEMRHLKGLRPSSLQKFQVRTFLAILGVGFSRIHKPYPYSLYRFSYLHFST